MGYQYNENTVPYKDVEKSRAAWRKYYQKNKPTVKALARKRNTLMRETVGKILKDVKNVPCTDCRARYPYYVMDLDHIDRSQKIFCLAQAVQRGFSLEKILTEIDKCEVVCSNCHRERTHRQKIRYVAEPEADRARTVNPLL